MKKIILFFSAGIWFYSSQALADVPGPDKTGCSTLGAVDLGYVLLPILLLGFLSFSRKPQKPDDT